MLDAFAEELVAAEGNLTAFAAEETEIEVFDVETSVTEKSVAETSLAGCVGKVVEDFFVAPVVGKTVATEESADLDVPFEVVGISVDLTVLVV